MVQEQQQIHFIQGDQADETISPGLIKRVIMFRDSVSGATTEVWDMTLRDLVSTLGIEGNAR